MKKIEVTKEQLNMIKDYLEFLEDKTDDVYLREVKSSIPEFLKSKFEIK